jgi:hypothetical protein
MTFLDPKVGMGGREKGTEREWRKAGKEGEGGKTRGNGTRRQQSLANRRKGKRD